MFRTLSNLFLIVIICFLASFMPLNTTLFEFPQNFLANFTLSKPVTKIEAISSSYETNLNQTLLYNPTNIEFTMIGELDKGSFVLGDSHDMILEVFNNDTLIKKYVNTEFVTGLISHEYPDFQIRYSFNISQENLELSSGHYKFKIYSTGEIFSNTTPYEVFVSYLSDSKYISTKDTVEDDQMYLTLYFPDDDYEYLLPVSRKIPSTEKIYRTTADNLFLGPDPSLGLIEGSPIPKITKVWVSQGIANIYLPYDIGIYDQDSSISQCAIKSVINTLTALDGIDKVKFLKGGKEVETFFHGTNVKDPFERNISPSVYLGLETNTERFLLVPIEINETSMEVQHLAPIIFNSLKTGIVNNNYHKNLLAIIPSNTELIDYKYSDNLLTLNLNSNFFNNYNERNDIQKMMLDSILYSFTSIPGVSKVSIIVNGNTIDSFNNIDLSQPLTAPRFINVENKQKNLAP